MGTQTATLKLTKRKRSANNQEIATVHDNKPERDIPSFGMCKSMANPEVAAKTAAAQGALTPVDCHSPNFTEWIPGASFIFEVLADGSKYKALTSDSRCVCAFAGVVTIQNANCFVKVGD